MGNSSSQDMSAPVIVASRLSHTATFIFLHGLGDTGHGWADTFKMMNLKHIKCICPHAPTNPVTLNAGMRMPSWFDIHGISPESPQDEEGIKIASENCFEPICFHCGNSETHIVSDDTYPMCHACKEAVKKLINNEVKEGIPTNRIVIGGFSQGGCVALYTTFTYGKPLAGVVALSTWMPLHQQFDMLTKGEHLKDIPIFQGHGEADQMVPLPMATVTSQLLKQKFPNQTFTKYQMMQHTCCPQELADIQSFLEKWLPDQ